MNLIQSLIGVATKPAKPLHVGEVMNLWKLMAAKIQSGTSVVQHGLLEVPPPWNVAKPSPSQT